MYRQEIRMGSKFSNLACSWLRQWDAVENKTTVITYAGGAILALWLTSVIVGAINSVPLVRTTLP